MVAVTKAWLRMVFVSLCILFCLEISISAQQSKGDWDGDDASPGHKDKFFSDLKVTRQRYMVLALGAEIWTTW
uniref:Uncharacterized protein n=1 Tax=Salvator merianae TaxID=96440 RepID=A0A8D0EA26_SALMN